MSKDKGASAKADRAGGLRPEPAAQSQPKALIPSAEDALPLPGYLRALASDCEWTDGWEAAAPDLINAAVEIERARAVIPELLEALGKLINFYADFRTVADGYEIEPADEQTHEHIADAMRAWAKATGAA